MAPNRPPAESTRTSRGIYWLQRISAHPAAALLAAGLSAGILVLAFSVRHPDQILAWFAGAVSSVTLLMVFVLQHTQTRHQAALQLKLDEVLRALPEADNRLMRLEAASETELSAIADIHSDVLGQATENADDRLDAHSGSAIPKQPSKPDDKE